MPLNRSKFLEPSEDAELLRSLRMDVRDEVLIAIARETGARPNEILSIRQSDLFKDSCTVFIRGLKGSRDREIPVRPELFQAMLNYIPFNISYRRLDQIWYKYRPNNKKFQSLRHTFAVTLYRKTKDIKLVQLALGHKSPTSTAIYTDFIYTTDELRKLIL